MTEGITGLILAGGTSSRMGEDKVHLAWGDGTLIEHVIETLRPLVDELIVAVKDKHAFRHLNARVVEDLVPDAHALGGIYTGLKVASHHLCFVCACDMPFLNRHLIRFLVGETNGHQLVIPRTHEGLQPLHAVYAKSALGAIEEQLCNRHWDLKALVPKIHTRVVEPELIHQFDPEEHSFFNVNTPSDLARAQASLQRRRQPSPER